jgi:hypothetical protein
LVRGHVLLERCEREGEAQRVRRVAVRLCLRAVAADWVRGGQDGELVERVRREERLEPRGGCCFSCCLYCGDVGVQVLVLGRGDAHGVRAARLDMEEGEGGECERLVCACRNGREQLIGAHRRVRLEGHPVTRAQLDDRRIEGGVKFVLHDVRRRTAALARLGEERLELLEGVCARKGNSKGIYSESAEAAHSQCGIGGRCPRAGLTHSCTHQWS